MCMVGGEKRRERECMRPLPSMFVEGLYTLLALSVPHPDCLVITTRHNQSTVLTELCTSNPVAMATQSKLKFLSIYCPHLNGWEVIN